MDATTTETTQSAANNTAAQTEAPETTEQKESQQEVIPATTADTSGISSDDSQVTLAETQPSQEDTPLTDTQKDILKIKQAISNLENLGEDLVGDELAALKNKLAQLEEKAEQEAKNLAEEVKTEANSLAEQFYEKTGIRPWGLLIVTALYLAVKIAGTLFPWLK